MKMVKYVLIGIAATILSVIIGNIEWTHSSTDINERLDPIAHRTSVTFIMGEDKPGAHFYEPAALHFATHREERTDLVLRSCRTLDCVIDYLNNSRQRGSQPWGVVNIVAHGNPNTGLRIDITDGGHRATPKRLLQAVLRSDLPPAEKDALDSITKVNFWSCGIGTSPLINLSLKQIFKTGLGRSADVFCSPGFVLFHSDDKTGSTSRLQASYWPFYYKRGYRPSNWEIAQDLATRYPEATIDWTQAVSVRERGTESEAFHNEYHIAVSLLRIYENKEDRPDFITEESKSNWALKQPELKDQINDSGIPSDKFHWTVNKIKHKTEDGTWVPAVKAVGMATVLFVLQEDAMESQPMRY